MSTYDDVNHNEYADKAATQDVFLARDDKGRVLVEHLTDRELLKESVILLRAFGDALEALSQHPMAAMIPGLKR